MDKEIIEGKVIAVWFSCGAASAVALKKTVELYGGNNTILAVNTYLKEEDNDNIRFLKDVEKWVGITVLYAGNKLYPNSSAEEVWKKRKYMSGVKGAPCTAVLKKEARYQFELENKIDFHVFGFTVDEKHRHDRFVKYERENVIPVLINEQLNKTECFNIINIAGIELPNAYKMGYPNANCIGCVKATGVTYWNHVRKMNPDVFAKRAELSRELGVRLVRYKGKRIFLDELPPDAKGNKMKGYECGIFCETKIKKA